KKLSEAKARAAEKERARSSEKEAAQPGAPADLQRTVQLRAPQEKPPEKTALLTTADFATAPVASEVDKTVRLSSPPLKPPAAAHGGRRPRAAGGGGPGERTHPARGKGRRPGPRGRRGPRRKRIRRSKSEECTSPQRP